MMLFGRTWKLIAELSAAHAVIAELRAGLATQRANADWLMAHVNELKIERAQLYQRLGVYVPVAEIVRAPGAAPAPLVTLPETLTNLVDGYTPDAKADIGDILALARDRRSAPPVPGESLNAADIGSLSFEDVGDEAAKSLGISHAADGTVQYGKA